MNAPYNIVYYIMLYYGLGILTAVLAGYIWLGPLGRGCVRLFGG